MNANFKFINMKLIFQNIKKIEIITGVFETFTIWKFTQGNTFITNGFISRVFNK